jgi:hypothetical protein
LEARWRKKKRGGSPGRVPFWRFRLGGRGGRVERSLYERANGYSYDAVKIFMPAGSKQPVVVHYVEHCPPDVAAAFIWLKNRDPERWRDVQNVEHVLGKYLISDHPLTEEEWARATVIDDVVEELPAPQNFSPPLAQTKPKPNC